MAAWAAATRLKCRVLAGVHRELGPWSEEPAYHGQMEVRKRTKGRPAGHPFLPYPEHKLLLNAEIGEDLGLGLVDGKQVVADAQSWVIDLVPSFDDVVAIVAAEAAGIAHVADVIGMRSPGDLHVGKDVGGEDVDQPFAGSFDEIGICGQHLGMLRRDRTGVELRGNLGACFGFGGVVGLQQLKSLFVDQGQLGADGAFGHGAIEGIFGGLHGVGRAVVAIDAVHDAALAFGLGALERGCGKARFRAVGIGALDPGNGGAGGIGGDVFDVAEVDAVDAGEVREGIDAAEVQDEDGLRFGVLFVVGKAGLDQELFTDEPRRSVAALADFTGGAQIADRGWNRVWDSWLNSTPQQAAWCR